MKNQDYIEDALHPDKPDSGYADKKIPGQPVRLPWWKRLWNWIKNLLDELF